MPVDGLKLELVSEKDKKDNPHVYLRASGTFFNASGRPIAEAGKKDFSQASARATVNDDGSLSFEFSAELVDVAQKKK